MANSKEKKKGIKEEVIGIALLGVSLFAIISLLSYSSTNISSNWGGIVGGYTAWVLFKVVGYSAYLFPILIIILAREFLIRREFNFRLSIPISLLFLLVAFSGLLSSLIGNDILSGGVVGKYVCLLLWDYLGWTGTLIFLMAMLLCSIIFTTGISFVAIANKGYNLYNQRSKAIKSEESEEQEPAANPVLSVEQKPEVKRVDRPAIIVPPVPKKQPKTKEPTQEHFEFLKATGEFQLPPLSFLDNPPEKAQSLDEEALRTNSKILEKKLKDYGVDGQVIAVTPGPVVTMYEFEPAAGIKVSSIVNLSDDLALALRATSIRIIAPIPGKAVVAGIARHMVRYRHPLPCLEACNARACLDYRACYLMAEHDRGLLNPVPLHYVAAADAARFNLDERLARPDGWPWPILDPDIFIIIVDSCPQDPSS